ncbi:hypothetical protein F4859DRAFT_422224 [Xylaria cf. heliscus]|nr:hypothetical protein F4859DRAFT_422224 [Xylaria cf. heliscus]
MGIIASYKVIRDLSWLVFPFSSLHLCHPCLSLSPPVDAGPYPFTQCFIINPRLPADVRPSCPQKCPYHRPLSVPAPAGLLSMYSNLFPKNQDAKLSGPVVCVAMCCA